MARLRASPAIGRSVPAPLPSWIRFRDGRVVPFESDLVSQMLFAATESVGSPNAFLARELADVVLHFLSQEDLGDTATAEQITDAAAKVLRELGQPELANRFAECWPQPVEAKRRELRVPFEPGESPDVLARRCLEEYSLRAVFAPDVAAAHRDGLIRLGNLDAPDRLSGVVLEPLNYLEDRAGRDWIVDAVESWVGDSPDLVPMLRKSLDDAARASENRRLDPPAPKRPACDGHAVGASLRRRCSVRGGADRSLARRHNGGERPAPSHLALARHGRRAVGFPRSGSATRRPRRRPLRSTAAAFRSQSRHQSRTAGGAPGDRASPAEAARPPRGRRPRRTPARKVAESVPVGDQALPGRSASTCVDMPSIWAERSCSIGRLFG